MGGEPEPDGLDLRRVVQVVVTDGTGRLRLASGYRVTRDLVLTAAHAMGDATSILARFFTGDGEVWEEPGESVWANADVDIALLRITVDARRGGPLAACVPPVRFGCVAPMAEADCGALGFPWFKLRDSRSPAAGSSSGCHAATTYRDSHYARGRATATLREGTLEFSVQTPPGPHADSGRSPWEGMSGAPVWSGGRVIGVVTAHYGREGPGMLTASQVERWYRLLTGPQIDELAQLMGLPRRAGELDEIPGPTPASDGPAAGELGKAARELADLVRTQWEDEEERRQVHDPSPLQVRFRQAADVRFDYWAHIRRVPLSPDPGPLPLADELDQIVKVYRSIPSGRLVVLGVAGAGKTILTTRFVLGLLKEPARGDRVPVIFELGSWDPTAIHLRDWMAERLVRDYGFGGAAPDGGTLADALIKAGRILPVLDGFDEIALDLQPRALEELNLLARMPLLLTSRTEEYTSAVERTDVLTAAAVAELELLTLSDLDDYLPGTSPPGPDGRSGWAPVLDELRQQRRTRGAENLAQALRTPLMVTMARTVYGHSGEPHPRELLNTKNFPGPEDIQKHLLAAFLPAAYRPHARTTAGPHRTRPWNPDPGRAEHWLRYLAAHLTARRTRNLEWWQLGTTMSRFARVCVIGFLAALAFGVTTGVGNIPVDLVVTDNGLGFAVERGLVVAVLHGAVAGLGFGAVYVSAYRGDVTPSRVRIQIFGRRGVAHNRFLPRFMAGLVLGALAAGTLVLVDRGIVTRLGLSDGLEDASSPATFLFVLGFGLATGLVLGLMAWLEVADAIDSAVSPAALLDSNRRNVLVHLLMWAIVFGTGATAVNVFIMGPLLGVGAGLVFGLEAAFAGGLGYGLSLTAWGQWVALARIWLPLTGRLPWRLITFLDDACERGVLRQSGAVYQFRHAQLQEHLATRPTTPTTPAALVAPTTPATPTAPTPPTS